MRLKHRWVTADEHGRLPALLLEWRETPDGWQARVVRPWLDVEDEEAASGGVATSRGPQRNAVGVDRQRMPRPVRLIGMIGRRPSYWFDERSGISPSCTIQLS